MVASETPKTADKKTTKQSEENQYIDYEPGTVDVGNRVENPQVANKDKEGSSFVVSKTTVGKPSVGNRVENPQVANKDKEGSSVVSKTTVEKPSAQLPPYSMSADPLFFEMLLVSQKGSENEKAGESESVKNLETSSQTKVDNSSVQPKISPAENTQPKTNTSENYSYMEYAPETVISVEPSLKSPTVARSYFNREVEDRLVKETRGKQEAGVLISQGSVPAESEVKASAEQKSWTDKDRSEAVVRQVLPMKTVLLDSGEDDDGYVGLDFGDQKQNSDQSYLSKLPRRGSQAEGTSLSKRSSRGSQGEGTSVDGDLYVRQSSRTDNKPRSSVGKACSDQTGTTGLKKKTSVSSLQEQDSVFKESNKENERSCESLNLKIPFPLSVTSNQELQKQNSMPCVALESEACRDVRREEEIFNRRSCSDLASEYEEMSLPVAGGKSSSSQQLSAMPTLNYAKLDLGSSEEIPGEQKFRQTRHPSSPDDSGPPVQGYAEIDFEMSDNLKNARSKEKLPVKFSLE
jgi:hypothetical protein